MNIKFGVTKEKRKELVNEISRITGAKPKYMGVPTMNDLVVELPLEEVAVGRLTTLLDAKEDLIKKALGVKKVGIKIEEDRVVFPWFKNINPYDADTYQKFIAALCKMTKDAKRVVARKKEIKNEKYEFRCFLLRLGFIGDEYKTDRKILLRNLEGSSAFKNGGSNEISM